MGSPAGRSAAQRPPSAVVLSASVGLRTDGAGFGQDPLPGAPNTRFIRDDRAARRYPVPVIFTLIDKHPVDRRASRGQSWAFHMLWLNPVMQEYL